MRGDKLCGTVIRCQYNKMDRLTEESHDGEAVVYSYAPCGNRMEKVDKNGNEVYTYNVKNQLASRKSEKAETYYTNAPYPKGQKAFGYGLECLRLSRGDRAQWIL